MDAEELYSGREQSRKLAIVTTHPIQYNAPLFVELNKRLPGLLKVFYTWEEGTVERFDPGFEKFVAWDIPLLEGYDYHVSKNDSTLPSSNRFFGVNNPLLIREIRQWGPDAVLVYGWHHYSHLKTLLYFKGKAAVLFRGDSHSLDEISFIRSAIRHLALRLVYRHVDVALYVGQRNRDYFLEHGLKDGNLVFCPHAVDLARFRENERRLEIDARNWRRELGFEDHATVVVFCGKLILKKNVNSLILCVQQANRSFKSTDKRVQLLVVGQGPLETELRNLSANDKNIIFLPFQNQGMMPTVYRIGDVYCLPSRGPNETWGISVNEAMACGRPAIVSSVVGCAVDLVDEHETGFIFNPADRETLTKLLIDVGSSPGMLRLKGTNSHRKISDWNLDQQIEGIFRALNKVLPIST